MKVEMLRSQFDILEEPREAIIVDAAKSPKEIIKYIRKKLYDLKFLTFSKS